MTIAERGRVGASRSPGGGARALAGVALCACLCVGAACGPPPQVKSAATVRVDELPSDAAALEHRAEELFAKADPVSLENALVVLARLRAIKPGYDVLWRSARAAFWVSDLAENDKPRRADFSNRGIDFARAAVAESAQAVEGHYYLSLCMGRLASTRTIGALDMLQPMLQEAKLSAELNEQFDHGGPRRLLGLLYVKAPGWPTSFGDAEKGVAELKRAVAIEPKLAPNQCALAEAYLDDEEFEAAEAAVERGLSLPPFPSDPFWNHRAAVERAACLEMKRRIADKRAAP